MRKAPLKSSPAPEQQLDFGGAFSGETIENLEAKKMTQDETVFT
jgi:hypothetical protein